MPPASGRRRSRRWSVRSSRRRRSTTSTSRCKAVPGHELPRDMPCFRDPDNLVYGKSEHGGMVFGGYELDPRSRWEDGVPWDHAARSLPADYERFAPLMAGAIRRFPFLADAEAIRLVCHPDAMTPDANPLLGPLPGVRGFWVAAGLSLNGFGGGGGIGRAMAGWITAGDPGVDIGPYRAWRFGDTYRDPGFAAGLARETYSDYYRLRYPYDADLAGRPRRLSALHGRLQEAGRSLRDEGRLGAGRLPRARAAAGVARGAIRRATAGHGRPGSIACVRRREPSASGRASSISRRSARSPSTGPGALGTAPAGQRQRCRPARRLRRLHAVVRRARRDRGRRDRHAPRRRPIPGRDRRRLPRVRARLAADPRRRRTRPCRSATSAVTCHDRAVGAAARGTCSSRRAPQPTRSATKRSRCAGARSIRVGPAPVDAARISYAGELGWELTTRRRMGGDRLGSTARRRRRASLEPSAIERSTRSAWRRATATSAPT